MSGDENSKVTDLFGNEVYLTKKTKGRPPFERTQENANKVSMLLAMGWSNSRIASVILDPRTGKPISEPTLKRYFRAELKIREYQRDMLISKQLMVAAEKAFEGNVGAMRQLEKLVEKNDMMIASARLKNAPKEEEEIPEEKLGKKERARRDAAKAVGGDGGGLWGNDLTPGRFDA